tara:strand:+ start:5 stop:601 length:597 start_codon:yes stop_codon:yes gene_type:complete
MALTKITGSGIGTVTDNVVITSDDPTITMTDSSGTNDIATLQSTSGALIITVRDGTSDGEIIFKGNTGSAVTEHARIANTGLMTVISEGNAVQTSVQQGLVKAFGKHSASAFVESFNYASFTDHGTGDHTGNFTSNMSNTTYVFGTAGEGGTDVVRYVYLYSPATSSVRFRTAYVTHVVAPTLADLGGNGNQITGDLA